MPIEDEDLSRAGMTLGKFCSPLDAFVPRSFSHRGTARLISLVSTNQMINHGSALASMDNATKTL